MSHRVLVCAAHFYPHHGGVERFTRELWGRLAERGWRIQVLTGDTGGGARREAVDGLTVLRLPVVHPLFEELPIPVPAPFFAAALRDVVRFRPEVVVTNTRFAATTLLGTMLAQLLGAPHLHIEHGSSHVDVGQPLGNALSRALDHSLGAWAVRHADRCVGVSGACAAFLRRLGADDPGTLPNGIDPARFAPRESPWRARLGIPARAPVLLYVGRLVAEKGLDDLVRAFELLGDGDAHLVLAGDGRHRASLEARARHLPRVHLTGRVREAEVPALLGTATVFVHPSTAAEGLPTAVLEAAAAGLPIVATAAGGTSEILASADLGLLVEAKNPLALAGALRGLLRDPARRDHMGAAVRRHVIRTFDWARIADRAEDELNRLIARPRRPGRRLTLGNPIRTVQR